MSIPNDFPEKLKHQVDIVDIINAYVPLKRAGANYKALSPFQKEKTPSFMVSPAKQSFHDYSSGKGGDIFTFVMEYEGLDFISAVRRVAEKAGVPIPETVWDGKKTDRRAAESLLSLQGMLAAHWRDLLVESPGAEIARQYMQKRNIPLQWAQTYCIGYAPDEWDASQQWAKKEGFTTEQLFECGLVIKNESGRVYDRFRGRLMFPISNEQGRVVGFSGRILTEDKEAPKYINTPETEMYKKSRLLFGLDRARRGILDQDTAIICEGQIDVLRCHDSGVTNVVAPLGTALTDMQIGLLKRIAKKIILCLDGDGAGVKSALRLGPNLVHAEEAGISALVQSELGISITVLPEGHDPDSFILAKGAEAFRGLLNEAWDYLDFFVEHQKKSLGFQSAAERSRVVHSVAGLIRLAPNAVIRNRLVSSAALRLDIPATVLEEAVEKSPREPRKQAQLRDDEQQTARVVTPSQKLGTRVQEILLILLSSPETAPEAQRLISPLWVERLDGGDVLLRVMEAYQHDEWTNVRELMSILPPEQQSCLSGLDIEPLAQLPVDAKIGMIRKLALQTELDYVTRSAAILNEKMRNESNPSERDQMNLKMAEFIQRKTSLTKSVSASC